MNENVGLTRQTGHISLFRSGSSPSTTKKISRSMNCVIVSRLSPVDAWDVPNRWGCCICLK